MVCDHDCCRRPGGLASGRFGAHIGGMNTGIPRVMYFTCPKCRLPYRARQEMRYEEHSGKVDCEECGTTVHEWTGFFDLFGWKALKPKDPRPKA
jgi:hypothetical protein